MSPFIGLAEVAALANVTPRALKKAALAIVSGKRGTWNGASFVIRQIKGRGGRSGWSYKVRADSLPEPLQGP